MYVATDYFDVETLSNFYIKTFKAAVHRYWDTLQFLDAMGEVIDTTPDSDVSLREVLIDILSGQPKRLEKKAIKMFLERNGKLTVEILKVETQERAGSANEVEGGVS